MELIEIHGNIQPVQKLPESESPIDLSKLDAWTNLDEQQRYFICVYFKNYPKITETRLKCGISSSKLTEWMKQDHHFSEMFNDIEDLHRENLSALNYNEAYDSARNRKDVLKAIGARGYESDKTQVTNILNTNEKSLPELRKALKKA